MSSPLIRIATGLLPALAFAWAFSLFAATSAEARERPQGDWYRYCKDVDLRGDWLEADCRKYGGGWRKNTRINFDNCPGNEVTVRDGHLVCERRYGGYGYNNGNRYGWDNPHNPHYGWDRRDNDRRDWDRRDWDRNRNDRDRHGWDGRRDNDRRDGDRDWTRSQDNDRRDGNWNGRRDDDKKQVVRRDPQQQQQQQQQQERTRQNDARRDADRRDDNNRRRDAEEWWKRGAG